jgi:hypothetical protein
MWRFARSLRITMDKRPFAQQAQVYGFVDVSSISRTWLPRAALATAGTVAHSAAPLAGPGFRWWYPSARPDGVHANLTVP